ncbi:MAG: endonuclease/exonuclease/phosphatase family protein [Steroidobacteraceae bacterium]
MRAFVVLLGAALAGSQFGEQHVILDNLSNFLVHIAAAFLLCAVILALARCSRWAFVSAVGLAVSLVPVVPWYFSSNADTVGGDGAVAKLLVSNVYLQNREYQRLARLIDEERPDIVGLLEVNSRWLDELPALRRDFPYRLEAPDQVFVGLALYSKLPLADPRIVRFGEFATPAIVATIQMPGGAFEIILAHTLPPMSTGLANRRNSQLHELSRYTRASQRPVLLAGDLNVTMWNRNYRSLARHGRLRNAREGHGVAPSWPPLRAFGIPIDHIMATAPLQLRNFRVHRSIGSDHLPISAEFSLAAQDIEMLQEGGPPR